MSSDNYAEAVNLGVGKGQKLPCNLEITGQHFGRATEKVLKYINMKDVYVIQRSVFILKYINMEVFSYILSFSLYPMFLALNFTNFIKIIF